MAPKRPKKNRSARDKQRAREQARREAQARKYPLHYLQPPYEPYQEWIRVPDDARDLIHHPVRYRDDVTEGAKDLADRVIKLGPRYHGLVPMAAIYLDMQIERGTIRLAVNGKPGYIRELSIAEMASDISNPAFADEMREKYPEADVPEPAGLTTDDAAAWHIHELHTHGYLILDDERIVNLAVPPKKPGGAWILNGHADI
jgi:hypothetical protein